MSSNIIDNIRIRGNQPRNEINKILAELQDLQSIDAEDEAVEKRIAIGNSTRKKSNSIGQQGAPNEILTSGPRDRRTDPIQYEMPTSCLSFPYTVTTNGMGNAQFPAGVENNGTKFGGRCVFSDGNNVQISYVSGSEMDIGITSPFTIAFWIRTTETTFQQICGTRNTVNSGQGISLFTVANIMRWDIHDGVNAQHRLDIGGFTVNTWRSVVCVKTSVADRNGMTTYIDKVGTTAGAQSMAGGDPDVGNGWGIGDTPAGTSSSSNSVAQWTFLAEAVNQAWVDDFHDNGHIDLSGGNFVCSIPFIGNAEVFSEATSNYCVSS